MVESQDQVWELEGDGAWHCTLPGYDVSVSLDNTIPVSYIIHVEYQSAEMRSLGLSPESFTNFVNSLDEITQTVKDTVSRVRNPANERVRHQRELGAHLIREAWLLADTDR